MMRNLPLNHPTEALDRRADDALPQDILQRQLVRMWQQLLAKSPINIDDDFFALGGTPELLARMLAASEVIFEQPVRASELHGQVTIRTFAEMLVSRLEAHASTHTRRRTEPPPDARGRPQDTLQDRLADLWERRLGLESVRINDDFFAIGGTPESAGQMFADVEARFGERLSDQDVLASGLLTVRHLADALVLRIPRVRACPIQAGAADVPPLFFLHGDFGGGGYYMHELARALGADQPVTSLHPHGIHGDEVPASIEAIAADHIAAVIDSHQEGPLYVGGHCLNAIVAFEMAQQLAAQGRVVQRLLLIDPPFLYATNGPAVLPPPRLSPKARQMPAVRVTWLVTEYAAIFHRYRPVPFAGPVSVFWGQHDPRPIDVPERRAVVESLAPDCEIHTCPGSHISMLGRHIRHAAGLIRESLHRRKR
jgi:surfactin synthase thioesterase subunit